MFLIVLLITSGVVSPGAAQLETCSVYETATATSLCPNGADAAKCNEYCKGKFGGELLGAVCSAEQPNSTHQCVCQLKCSCDVYEQERTTGLCANGTDAARCNEYCEGKFSGELLGAECSPERPNKQRECVCKLKCCTQGAFGLSNCRTCDGAAFGYQGLQKHYMLKPITNYSNIPYFAIIRLDKLYHQGPDAIMDSCEVRIKDWKITVAVKASDGPAAGFIVKVNGVALQDLPYRWSKLDDHRERFVNVVWGNAAEPQVILTTSFGIRVVLAVQGANNLTSLSIDTPRHPELKNHMEGLVGRWNDDPSDDSIDANGVKQPLDDFSRAFGDSWIVPKRTKTPEYC